MSEYTPTVWRTGDVITAEKLNKIEEGIANAESVTIEALSVTENGTYSEEGKAYSPVTVNVAEPQSTIPLKTANVTVHYDETGATPTGISSAEIMLLIKSQSESKNIGQINYDDIASLPITTLGTLNSMAIPVYDDPNGKSVPVFTFYDNDNILSINTAVVNSGDAVFDLFNGLLISGDCDITLKLVIAN